MNPIATRMNYMRDTLLGPISKSAECNVVITPITPGAFQVQVLSPVPDDLHKAHSLTIFISSNDHLTGTIAHTRNLDNGELELQIDV
ncbi:hypothetical protein [Pseudomonas mandelii]|uniref:hypothetical protein n=1 Tax=Pseudomonas mandelii TaxID=75612 RepID=UPI00224AC4F6|nr:hypothetical protein [Pseudomonas mandelii]MCX2901539.1 hypothetical protein [Pseudomonas mandelii]